MREAARVDASAWPLERLGEALALLAHRRGMIPVPERFPAPPAEWVTPADADVRRFVLAAADHLEIEAEPRDLGYAEVETRLARVAPALFRLPKSGEEEPPRFLAVARVRGRRVYLLDPDGAQRVVPLAEVAAALRRAVEERFSPEIDRLLDEAEIVGRRRALGRAALLRERAGARPVASALQLRLPPSAPAMRQVREAGLPGLALGFFAAYVPKIVFWLGAFWVLWRGALGGQVDWGWLVAWVLMLWTNLPFRLLEPWFSTLFTVGVGWLLKRRLLAGALSLEPEEIRHQGTGQLLSRTIESEAAESLTLEAGVLLASHGTDLVVTTAVLAGGVGGWPHVALLYLWVFVCALALRRYYLLRHRWTQMRLDATHHLVEQMVGHQTRLAQESTELRHQEEDAALAAYLRHSRKMDLTAAAIAAAVPGGWLVLSLLLLAPAIIVGDFTTGGLALSLGGTLFLLQSLDLLSGGLLLATDAVVVWGKVIPLFRAAARPRVRGLPEVAFETRASQDGEGEPEPLIDATDLVYGYREGLEPVLKKCALKVRTGDRILLEGASGGGKSTLLALLTGLRAPQGGLLLLDGLDRSTLGESAWRRRVAAAPQFHENHVFLGTFAFNLLLGREWPPRQEDMAEAEVICRALGLEELLQKMPAGLLQMVGETGWQLSHGERSRLFIARALLQRADLLGFDESFAALDPVNLERALEEVLKRSPTLLVVAHP